VWIVGQHGLTITGLQQAGAQVVAQQDFDEPQFAELPQNNLASARLAMPNAASTAPVNLIHLIEANLLPLGITFRSF